MATVELLGFTTLESLFQLPTIVVAIGNSSILVEPKRHSRGNRSKPQPMVNILYCRIRRGGDVFVSHPQVPWLNERDREEESVAQCPGCHQVMNNPQALADPETQEAEKRLRF